MHAHLDSYILMYVCMYANVAEMVQSITENFQLEFGSFVDKPWVTYISGEPSRSV